VSTHSVASIVPGLRNYDVAVQDQGGNWATVGQVRDQFFAHRQMVAFAPRVATAVRVSVSTVNYGGLAGGLKPWFWTFDAPAVVYELAAYEPGGRQ
ncbi:MAG: hypothetical protein M3378_12630, partial [Actinomycetota bacterium]|nr:hypothetical protein [Actinomycetota bacterium]